MPVARAGRHTIAPMCSIGRNSDSAIGAASGSTLGGSLLTGGGSVATGRTGGTLLTSAVGASGASAKPGGSGNAGTSPGNSGKTRLPQFTQ